MPDSPAQDDDAILARLENKALHYLGRYASTRRRLTEVLSRFARRKLPGAGNMEALIARKVEECARRGYVNDAAYAEAKAASMRRAGGARRAIEAKLRMAGVARDIIETALGDDNNALAERTAALAYARRRRLGPFATGEKRSKEGWETRHLGSLARAGFGYPVARFVLDFHDGRAVENWLADNRLADNPPKE